MTSVRSPVDLGIRQVATLLGRSERTIRARLQSGELSGRKIGGRWTVRLLDLPITDQQRQRMLDRAEEFRTTAERVLPAGSEASRNRKSGSSRSVDNLRAARSLASIALELGCVANNPRGPAGVRSVVSTLDHALDDLAVFVHEFEPKRRLRSLQRARTRIARATARLLRSQDPVLRPFREQIEHSVLPAIGGLLRSIHQRGQEPGFNRRSHSRRNEA